MNPLTNVKNIQKLNEKELELGVVGKKSWHDEYKDSAWIFIGGLPYDLSEGDIICVFSQYGEVVNMNLVRDHKTGKSKGFAFLCYADQRSTVLSVDNLNGIKILSRVIRVDHVKDYKVPKDHKDDDELIIKMRNEGCAPQIKPDEEAPERKDVEEEEKPTKKRKKEKKVKKKRKKSEKKKRLSSTSSGSSDDESGSDDSGANAKLTKVKKEIKQEVHDRGYDRSAAPSTSLGNGVNARGRQNWAKDRDERESLSSLKKERKTTNDHREKDRHREKSEKGWGRSASQRDDVDRKDSRGREDVYDDDRSRDRDRRQDLVRESDKFREADRSRDYYRDRGRDRDTEKYRDSRRDRERDSSGYHDRYREEKRKRDRSRDR